jgi:dTDP-4-amino-4,6-dideoxygalactose transaminase
MSMSVEDLVAKLKPWVKAVMVYHVAGYPSDTKHIATLCRDRGIPLIEDCNNAIGATLDGRPVGVFGEYAVYSLYPSGQINGINGGMLATPDLQTAERATRLRRFGVDESTFRDARGEINPHSDIPEIGWSSALSNLNAAVALCQLSTLSNRVERTTAAAEKLERALSGLRRLRIVRPMSGATSAFWGFLVLSKYRDTLLEYLAANGIKSSILHQRNDFYTGFDTSRAVLPGTELVMNQLLALPCGYWLNDAQLKELIDKVTEFDALLI